MAQQTQNKIYFRQNLLFLLSNGYKLVDFDELSIDNDFGVKKTITYHFIKESSGVALDNSNGIIKLDITESNLFNIELQTNTTFRSKYIKEAQ